MVLEEKAIKELDILLQIAKDNFVDMLERWQDLEKNSVYKIRNTENFKMGYVFGKIEHKFISWFYSEYGQALTDDEYEEFMEIVKKQIL